MVRKIIAKEDFLWYKKGQQIPEADYNVGWGHLVTIIDEEEQKVRKLDLNKDGVVDEVDVSLAKSFAKEVDAAVPKKSLFKKRK